MLFDLSVGFSGNKFHTITILAGIFWLSRGKAARSWKLYVYILPPAGSKVFTYKMAPLASGFYFSSTLAPTLSSFFFAPVPCGTGLQKKLFA